MKRIMQKLKDELDIHTGADALFSDTLRAIKSYDFSKDDEDNLKALSHDIRLQALHDASLDTLLPKAFALAAEVSWRVLGLRPYDTQLLTGIALHHGYILQMQTGEGKTLAAVFPAFLNALTGKGVHVLTFNDYLAKRDANWMGPIYQWLGLTTGWIAEEMENSQRKKAYASDITYVSAKEAGFDYLRDFLCLKHERLVHRPLNMAIVDEADSIMIDEARIPLVLSGRFDENEPYAREADRVIPLLTPSVDFRADQYNHNLYFTDEGFKRLEELLEIDDLFTPEHTPNLVALHGALHAHGLLTKNKDYIVRQGKIEIIDPFTGRVAHNRLYPDNIQVAVEVKEGLSSHSRGRVMGKMAIHHFLSLYEKVSGMTGTAQSARFEFEKLYRKHVIEVPTQRPCRRVDHHDRIFSSKKLKVQAILDEIARLYRKGQPILIGTGSIEESEQLYASLKDINIPCTVLNACNDEAEARIIAEAGRLHAVTVSTNMAGRGVDIRLGGACEAEKERVMALGGLYVLGTQRHESMRIDDQLRGRAGRQGEPGESKFFISIEDEIFQKYGQGMAITRHAARGELGEFDGVRWQKEIIALQRLVEGYHSDLRYQLLRFSAIIEQQRRLLHRRRQAALIGQFEADEGMEREFYRIILLDTMNHLWMDYLEEMESLREGIHMVALGNKNPHDEFNRAAIGAFARLEAVLDDEARDRYHKLYENRHEIMNREFFGPTSTFTYLLEEDISGMGQIAQLIRAVTTLVSKPLFSLWGKLSKKQKSG